eukprot:scaffold876_cov243-Pinguiococcus_pyrenoidosus.AAC.41
MLDIRPMIPMPLLSLFRRPRAAEVRGDLPGLVLPLLRCSLAPSSAASGASLRLVGPAELGISSPVSWLSSATSSMLSAALLAVVCAGAGAGASRSR